jgi:hypothetical protein
MSHVSRALPYQLQHRARWAELSIPLTVRTAFEQPTLGHRPGVLLFGWNNRPECPLSTQSGHRNAPADGWARRVASLTAVRCVQAPNSKPSVARMMNCAPIEATRNFHRTPAGNRAVAHRSMSAMKGPLSLGSTKADCFGRGGGIHYCSLAGRGPPKNRGGAFRFRCPRAAPPSATIRHLHDQRVRRQGDTL